MNRIPSLPGVEIRTARHVRFLGPEGEPVQSDGDVIGHMPMEISLGEATLTLIVADPERVRSATDRHVAPDSDARESVREAARPSALP
jgi:hypothetical protein